MAWRTYAVASRLGGYGWHIEPRTDVRGYLMPSLRDWGGWLPNRTPDLRPGLSYAVASRLGGNGCHIGPRTDVRGYRVPSLRDWGECCHVEPRTDVRGYLMPSLRDWWEMAANRRAGTPP